MKSVTVNIQIQFDVFNDDKDKIKEEAIETLDSMTKILQERMGFESPIILTNSIDSSDIEISIPVSECCEEEIEQKIHDTDGTNLEEFPTCKGCGEVCQES